MRVFRGLIARRARASAGAMLVSVAAFAQSPAPSPAMALLPQPAPLHLWQPFGEPTSAGGLPPPAIIALPLRLSLLGSLHPTLVGVHGADCAASAEASGNSIRGFPVQHAAAFSLAPRLTLHGFSQLGCPLDAGLGGGVSYTVPLRPNLWLNASAGVLGQPGLPSPAPLRANSRVDFMVQTPSGRIFSVGVSAGRRGGGLIQALTFTGSL